MLNVKQGNCEYQLLKSFGLTRQEIESRSSDYEADFPTIILRAGYIRPCAYAMAQQLIHVPRVRMF